MGESFISSLHIQKLGHKIEEIRIRALNHIISKLDHVPLSNVDFSRSLDLLKKLLDWFDFEPQNEEEKVLNLIHRILKSDEGVLIVKHVGTVALTEDLKKIRSKIKGTYHNILDKIIEIINIKDRTPGIVPPLISDFPLSYRSDQPNNNTARSRFTISEKHVNPSIKTIYCNDKQFGTTASTISGFEVKSCTASGVQTGRPYEDKFNSNSVSPVRDLLYKSVPFVTLKWQELGKSDCHVLKSVEESLQRPPQPSVLIHSCEFFCNVMLQDFPAEIFLQRPMILSLFYDMIYTSPSTRITNAALTCLNKLSEKLIIRIRYYSDPCTFNLKQGLSLMYEPDSSTSARKGFFYNIDLKNISSDDAASEDSSLLQCNQLTLPQYCMQTFICVLTYMAEKPQSFKDSTNKKKTQSGINTALQLIDKLVTLIAICIKPSIWDYQGDSTITDISKQLTNCLDKIGDVLEQYRLMVVASDMEYFDRMAQLFLLHSTSHLLTELIPITKADMILPRTLKNALSSSLLDASFGRLYPAAHESLLQYVNELKGFHETESLAKYKDVQVVCKAMTKAIPILKSGLHCHSSDNIHVILESLPSLEFHKNLNIINTFLKICVKNNVIIKTDEHIANTISEILVCLLSHVDKDIREETYSLCQKLIVNILGLNHTKHMSESDPGSQVIFFLHPDILIEIAAHGLNSDSVQIQTDAEDILIHLLKCKYLVSESVWRRIIRAVMLAMPILQCYAGYETPLGKSIIKIMDPDISPSLFLPLIDVLKGNFRMLFCKDKRLRNEAVCRLCWLLTTEEGASEKIPRIKSLDDCGLSYIFQIDYPIDFSKKRGTRQFYQASSLLQVLDLLEAPGIEPSIRRSALTQIAVMLEDHFLHPAFLERNGLALILNILESALHEKEYHNYPDSVIPIVSIFKHICLYNSIIRHELSHNIQFVFNILRGLLLYCTDKRIQNDGSMLCCLLLFSEFAIYNFSRADVAGFSLPAIVVEKFNMPFKCNAHWATSRHAKPCLTGLLMADDWCRSTLRMHWNIEWNGGIGELINWPEAPNIDDLSAEQLAEFSVDLRLKNLDLKALKASSVEYCCQQYLLDIENANTHQSVLEAIRGITGYIALWLLSRKCGNTRPNNSLLELPWNSSFFRFLSAPPANHDDQNLLVELLRCLTIMLDLYKNSGKNCWIVDVLQDTAHYLSRLLKIDVNNEHRLISMELLTLIAKCSTSEQHISHRKIFIDNSTSTGLDIETLSAKPKNWINIIQIITENLKYSDTEQFYNLAYLDKLLYCMVEITCNLGWSECERNSLDFHKLFPELIEAISELLTAFHYGKGTEAASSFMGLNITRNALLTMNHILFEMQQTNKKNWVHDSMFSATVFSLFSLWSCRDVIVRAATLQLLAGLATSARGATLIVENVRHKSNNVWETTLMILLDHSEASVVREQAAVLLANLTSHVNVSSTGQITLPLCHAPITSKKDISSIEAVLLLLKEYNFFEEIHVLLSCLYLDINLDPSIICCVQKSSTKTNEASTARSYVPTSSSSKSSENGVNVFVTPSLVKAVAYFFNNLLYIAPVKITNLMSTNELVRSFFRCLTSPTKGCLNDSGQFLLYCDTVQMCSAVCSTLTRSVQIDGASRSVVLHTRDCLYVLIYLLNPNLYIVDDQRPHFLYLRNHLWSEIFRLITALIEVNPDKFNQHKHSDSDDSYKESYDIFTSLLCEIGHKSFIHSVCESIESKTAQVLQISALQSLTSLLSVEKILSKKNLNTNSTFSLQKLCDATKSPRNTENTFKKCSSIKIDSTASITSTATNMNIMIGEDLCKTLLRLYELQSVENNSDSKKKGIIIGTLSSLLSISKAAKTCALREGFLCTVFKTLKRLHVDLSLHSAESLRRTSEKKKVCPILKEVDSLFCLLTNFLSGNEAVKKLAATSDLADIIHKYWVWFAFDYAMLINILKLLCTFTTNEEACQSLTLTNPTPGSGPRKVATNISLVNALIHLVTKEMELVSRKHDTIVLQLTFSILQNACFVQECRNIIVKTNLFQSFNKLHPAITKRQKPWDIVEGLWLQFLQVFTYYPEGQVHVVKSNDVLDLLITLTNGQKASNKLASLSTIRNVAFYQSNRIKLLASVDFIQMLLNKLNSGTMEEKNIVISIVWVLVANSQKSKIALKCAGLDTRIRETIKMYEMQGIEDKSYETMVYVLGVLKEGEK